ncbi:hypothetical protein PRK78_004597 [Emydomyces testavorans]|uniref:NADH dehydrogenase [ubiquinone] 1 beta subcomplex subunit 7 n=1 Tax=Emydomyces testavorans TaxID=2070801 RepID=A0AAF0IJD3_9EURO|nr:hypothetical protein PRK78_004597 [Emydomyces testavorans]
MTLKELITGQGSEPTAATREEMSNARLPLAYRDSCAHLLIPLNRCRVQEYYLPWKCEVRHTPNSTGVEKADGFDYSFGIADGTPTEREAFLRKMPIRGVQETGCEDG